MQDREASDLWERSTNKFLVELLLCGTRTESETHNKTQYINVFICRFECNKPFLCLLLLFYLLFFFFSQISVILTDPFLYNGNLLPPLLFQPLRVTFCSSPEIRMMSSCFSQNNVLFQFFAQSVDVTSPPFINITKVTFLSHKRDDAAWNVLKNSEIIW